MTPEEITDRDTLERWLQTRPGIQAAIVAHLAAMRAFPNYTKSAQLPWFKEHGLDPLKLLRALLTAQIGLMGQFSGAGPNVSLIAKQARVENALAMSFDAIGYAHLNQRSDKAESMAANFATYAADSAAYALEALARPELAIKALEAASSIFDIHGVAHQVSLEAANLEEGRDLLASRLWSGHMDSPASDGWDNTKRQWQTPDSPYAFWLRWYQSALDGTPQHTDLLREIALIPDDDWKKGEAHIAGLIAEIELRYAIKATPNAESIILNPATGLLRVETVSHLSGKHRADVVDTLRDAASIFDQGSSGNQAYAMLFPERDLIVDACDRYANRPIMLLRVCRRVVARVNLKEAEGECPKGDALVADFVGSIAGAAGDLMAFDADVKEAETARLATHPVVVSPEAAKAIVAGADASSEISEGDLKLELPLDARAITSGPTVFERQIALYQTRSRLLRVFGIVKNAGKSSVDHLNKHAGVYGLLLAIAAILMG